MPHVGDGEIHAYLDGALDLFPRAEAERIRSHLRSCPDCDRRLAEEKALREGAEAILSAASPEVGEAPPFEEIRARAAAARPEPAPRGRRVPRNLLPWAASIVLALAVGWGTRGVTLDRVGGAPDVGARSAVEDTRGRGAQAEAVSPEVLDAVAAGATAPGGARTADRADAGDDSADGDLLSEDASRTAEAPTGTEARQAQDGAARLPSAPESDVVVGLDKALADAKEEEYGGEEMAAMPVESAVTPLTERSDVPARQASSESPPAPASGQERFAGVDEPMPRRGGEGGELQASVGALESPALSPVGLMVPGLPVESIAVDPALGPAGGLRIVQRLPGGERLELLFVSGTGETRDRAAVGLAEGDRVAIPTAPRGWSRLDLSRSGGLLVAQSAVSVDSLAALMAHLR